MCKKKQFKYCPSEIDECMRDAIMNLKKQKITALACCCGHKKYHMTIVIDIGFSKRIPLEIFSNIQLERKKKFYKKDKKGYYFIPEVESYWKDGKM